MALTLSCAFATSLDTPEHTRIAEALGYSLPASRRLRRAWSMSQARRRSAPALHGRAPHALSGRGRRRLTRAPRGTGRKGHYRTAIYDSSVTRALEGLTLHKVNVDPGEDAHRGDAQLAER